MSDKQLKMTVAEATRAMLKDKLVSKEELPVALFTFGSMVVGANFKRVCKWTGTSRTNKEAREWWANLGRAGYFSRGKVVLENKEPNDIELCLMIAVAQGLIAPKLKTKKGVLMSSKPLKTKEVK
jgi:hypothetical protein